MLLAMAPKANGVVMDNQPLETYAMRRTGYHGLAVPVLSTICAAPKRSHATGACKEASNASGTMPQHMSRQQE